MSEPEQSLLSFMIGPVQPFIESARTLRDLWSGSYLLSWLTAAAMQPIITQCGTEAFISPHVDDQNPLLAAMRKVSRGDANATLPSLPNKFAALVPTSQVEALRVACMDAMRAEWKAISDSVHTALTKVHHEQTLAIDWDINWKGQKGQLGQLEDFFEVRCVARGLQGNVDDSAEWKVEWDHLGALMEMTRSVRHVPRYTVKSSPNDRYPAKCSLLGTLEQMGPAGLAESKRYWEALSSSKGVHGTRLQSVDRLCAVSLVKRFAWPSYFADTNGGNESRLGLDVRALRFSDSATIAAGHWLAGGEPLVPFNQSTKRWARDWSGQWLHWTKPRTEDGEECPQQYWDLIQEKRKIQGSPPAYYAILHMDGDNMGLLFQGDRGPPEWGQGKTRYQEITRRMTEYSLKLVEGIVERHSGELIYAGGDDVLAILPTSTAIACAQDLRQAFSSPEVLGSSATASAGIAVVHYKEDLRFALDVARRAEKSAKKIGKDAKPNADKPDDPPRKDALAITVCRHSGEHSTGVMGWEQAASLNTLVKDYAVDSPPSDRWAYKLRDELPVLQGLVPQTSREYHEEVARNPAFDPLRAVQTELKRLLKRTESSESGFREGVVTLFASYVGEMTQTDRSWSPPAALEGFATICQTASFLARGRE